MLPSAKLIKDEKINRGPIDRPPASPFLPTDGRQPAGCELTEVKNRKVPTITKYVAILRVTLKKKV